MTLYNAEDRICPFHILGDAAFPNLPYKKVPHKGQLTEEQSHYNAMLIPQRVVVERCFGYFKSKFQKFRHEIYRGDKINTTRMFFAAAIIHNITIDITINNTDSSFLRLIEEILEEERAYK